MVAFQPQADPHPVRGSRLWPGIGQPGVSLAHQESNLLEMEISSQFLEMCQRSGPGWGVRVAAQAGRGALERVWRGAWAPPHTLCTIHRRSL